MKQRIHAFFKILQLGKKRLMTLKALKKEFGKLAPADSTAVESLLLAFEKHGNSQQMRTAFLEAQRFVRGYDTIEELDDDERQLMETLSSTFDYIERVYYSREHKKTRQAADPHAFFMENVRSLVEYLFADFRQQSGDEGLNLKVVSKKRNYSIITAIWYGRVEGANAGATRRQEIAALCEDARLEYAILSNGEDWDVFFFSIDAHFTQEETRELQRRIDECLQTESMFYRDVYCYFLTFNDHETLRSGYFSVDLRLFRDAASLRLIRSPQFWAYLWRDLWYYSLPDFYKIYRNPLVWVKVDLAEKEHAFKNVAHREFAKLLKKRSEPVESAIVSTISAAEYVGFVTDWSEDNLTMLKNQAITLPDDEGEGEEAETSSGFVAVPRNHSYRTQFMVSKLVNTQCMPVSSSLQPNIGDDVPHLQYYFTAETTVKTYARINGIIEFPIIEYVHEWNDPSLESYTEAGQNRNSALKEEYNALVADRLQIFEQVQRETANAKAAQEEEARRAAADEERAKRERADNTMKSLLSMEEEEQMKQAKKDKKELKEADIKARKAKAVAAAVAKRLAAEGKKAAEEADTTRSAAEAARAAEADAMRSAEEARQVAEAEAKRAAAEYARAVDARAGVDARAAVDEAAEQDARAADSAADRAADDASRPTSPSRPTSSDHVAEEVKFWKKQCRKLTEVNAFQAQELKRLNHLNEDVLRTRGQLISATQDLTDSLRDELRTLRTESDSLREQLEESKIDFENGDVMETKTELQFAQENENELIQELQRCSSRTLDKLRWVFKSKQFLQAIFALPTSKFYRLCKQNTKVIKLVSVEQIREMFQA